MAIERSGVPATMLRLAKQEGFGRIALEEAPVPVPKEHEVLVRTRASLISRGSELGGRYLREERVDPIRVGYAAAGEIVATGRAVHQYHVGDRVYVVGPHAQYVIADATKQDEGLFRCQSIGERLSYEVGAFVGLTVAAIGWVDTVEIEPGETVVILGQGIVGSLMTQVARARSDITLIAVDRLPLRCDFARRVGADVVINAAEEDVVEAVKVATSGRGADVVIDAVGGSHGVESFKQAQALCRSQGRIMLVGMYQTAPLTIDANALMTRTIIGGNSRRPFPPETWEKAVELLERGVIRAEEMITHRFPFRDGKKAFDLLYERPGEALGVILQW